MVVNCAGAPNPIKEVPTKKAEWSEGTTTTLEKLAARRAQALEAQASMYSAVDPVARRAQESLRASQQWWESMVWDAGRRSTLSPTRVKNAEAWLANWLGQKSLSMGLVREPLLNVKRITNGTLREAGVYAMMGKTRKLAADLQDIAKLRGVKLEVDDTRRLIEEGLTPQRLNVYGNTQMQEAVLTQRYNDWSESMLKRGFTKEDLTALLDTAQDVTAQWDVIQAISKATGMDVGDMVNVGYFPRQFTKDGYTAAKLKGAVNPVTMEEAHTALAKSRATWQYLPEDEKLSAMLLDISVDELNAFISRPADFAVFLSKKVSPEQLDLLVESGVMSKIPMLTSHVEEFLAKTYKLPLIEDGLFIRDPLAATAKMIERLQGGIEQSALVKYIDVEGVKSGWSVSKELAEADPEQFGKWVPLRKVPGFENAKGTNYVHPDVAAHAAGILELSRNPAAIGEVQQFYNWFTRTIGKQALGNPISSNVYLFGQYMGNMLGAVGRGVPPSQFHARLVDMIKLTTRGVEAFDNVKPFRYVDGVAVTHREFITRSLRMFSHDILPDLNPTNVALDLKELNPLYTLRQFQQLAANANDVKGYAGEVAALLERKADVVLTPVLRIAQLLDTAGQLSIMSGRAQLAPNVSRSRRVLSAADEFIFGLGGGEKLPTWEELVLETKRAMPQFDDLGKVPRFVSKLIPFSSWAMANLPLQLKSMMREPSRWHNYTRMYSLWNAAQEEANSRAGIDPTYAGEMQEWERDQYGLITQVDPLTRKTTMMMTSGFDPRWGVLAGAMNLFAPPTIADTRRSVQGNGGVRFLEKLVGDSYLGGFYELISGIDPLTGIKRDDSTYESKQFANIPMPPWMATLLSISPVLSSIDRLEFISGTKDSNDPRTGELLRAGVQGWLGNKGNRNPKGLVGVEGLLQSLGARVRVIDGLTNMQFTELDTVNAMSKLGAKSLQAQKELQQDLNSGAVKRDSPEYNRRVEVIQQMYNTAIQLNYDLRRIEAWAIKHKVPQREWVQLLRDKRLTIDNTPLPGADKVQKLIQDAYDFNRRMP